MIVAISYHQGDQQLMTRWANRVKQLGPYLNHEIILSPCHGATTDKIKLPLENCFRKVHVVPSGHQEKGWPISCNRAFQNICWSSMLTTRQPFLFMEPDAIPLCEGWIDQIEEEYRNCGQPFMGDFVQLSTSDIQNGIDHMSGIAVYDWNLSIHAPRLFNCTNGREEYAWDIWAASDILPKMRQTNLIQHDWRGTGDKPHQWRKNNVDPSFVREGAVIYHPDKRGVLLNDGLAGEGTRVVGELRTGAPESVSSFEQPPPAPVSHEEEPKIQSQEAPQDQQTIVVERLNSILADAESSPSLKRKVKQSLIQYGWVKKAKGSKQSGKKVRSAVGKHRRSTPLDGISVSSCEEVEG
jgi:hypothetical protein